MKPYNNVLDMIGQTPIVRINNMDTGPCELYIKLENQNPGGSIKDRPAMFMIEAAELSGQLKPGGEIFEATAGNTGLGLALVSKLKGYKLTLVVPDKMSQEKISHLRAFGTNVILTRSDVGKGHPEYYQDLAKRLADERGGFFINQFENPANPKAHRETTAPEIWEQMEHKLDALVSGVGSSGHITGFCQYFKDVHPDLEIVLADPDGSILADYVNTGTPGTEVGSWLVEGIGEDFIPSISDFSLVKKAYSITDKESFDAARNLLMKEGIFAGSSSGTLLAAALKYCQAQTQPKRVLTIAYDSGNKYLTKMFNDFWMLDQGFLERPTYGDLRDYIARKSDSNQIISAKPDDALNKVYAQMKSNDISQIPLMENGKVAGIIDETDLLLAVTNNPKAFSMPARDIMSANLIKISPNETKEKLFEILTKDYVAIVEDQEKFYGLITKIDYIAHQTYQGL